MDLTVSEKEILVSQFVNDGILNFNGLVNRPIKKRVGAQTT